MTATYELSHLELLEAEAVHIFREVAATCERPALLFSGGKDSVVMLHVAAKAFWPAPVPFPVVHIDTGENFDEVIEFRDRTVAAARAAADRQQRPGRHRRRPLGRGDRTARPAATGCRPPRCCARSPSNGFGAVFGGARRDEEKARAKERVFSFRDEFGQWDPRNQRPELWSQYNPRHRKGEHIRVFPLSNWTELDIWSYIRDEHIDLPSLYYAHRREVVERDGMLLANTRFLQLLDGDVAVRGHRALPHRRRRHLHRLRRVGGRHRGRGGRRGCRGPDHRTRRHPRRRPDLRGRHGRPQERGLFLMAAAAAHRDGGQRGRRQVDAHRAAAVRLEGDLRGPAHARSRRTSRARGDEQPNLALLTDGLRAEREQGITIDVAYRYFATPRRKFIIADTPGHIQYTRNMVTGASTADVALILIDARNGVLEQSRRHAFLASLLGIPHLVVCINKMDLVDYSERALRGDPRRVPALRHAPRGRRPVTFVPVSALLGDNVVQRSAAMPWYEGTSLLHHLEELYVASDRNLIDARFPVQYVIRPQSADERLHDFRGYAGTIAGGVFQPGDEVTVLPSGFATSVEAIWGPGGVPIDEGFAGQAVTMQLADHVDVSRGDLICRPHNRPHTGQDIDAMVCWLTAASTLTPGARYTIQHTTSATKAVVKQLDYRLDVNTLHRDEAAESLSLNEIGRVRLRTQAPLHFDPYRRNRDTGSFILIDEATNSTVAAGMISRPSQQDSRTWSGTRVR